MKKIFTCLTALLLLGGSVFAQCPTTTGCNIGTESSPGSASTPTVGSATFVTLGLIGPGAVYTFTNSNSSIIANTYFDFNVSSAGSGSGGKLYVAGTCTSSSTYTGWSSGTASVVVGVDRPSALGCGAAFGSTTVQYRYTQPTTPSSWTSDPTALCVSASAVTYSFSGASTYSTSYTWSVSTTSGTAPTFPASTTAQSNTFTFNNAWQGTISVVGSNNGKNTSSPLTTPTITVSANPSAATITSAAAQEQCANSTFSISATSPATGTGTWSIVSGPGSITSTSSASTTVTGVTAGSTTTVKWTVHNGVCTDNTATCTLTNDGTITVPSLNAGSTSPASGSSVCPTSTISVYLNDGSGGTGTITNYYRYSIDGGTNWLPGLSGQSWSGGGGTNFNIVPTTSGTNEVIVQTKRTSSTSVCTTNWTPVASWTVYTPSTTPGGAATSSNNYCASAAPASINLTIGSGTAGNDGAVLKWYSGSCGGTYVGTGTGTSGTFTLSGTTGATAVPTTTTTYYARFEGTCSTTTCSPVTITVNQGPTPTGPSTATVVGPTNPACSDNLTSLTLSSSGGTVGTGGNAYWYTDNTGTNLVGIGYPSVSGVTNPGTTTNYYVRYESTCGNSAFVPVTYTVHNAVAINTQPSDAAVCETGNTSFSVAATGDITSYRWSLSTDGGSTYSSLSDGGVYSGASASALNITGATTGMSGYKYKVTINGTSPCGSKTSNAVTLTVVPNVTSYGSVSGTSQTLCSNTTPTGEPFSVSGASGGNGFTYTWYSYNGLTSAPTGAAIPGTWTLVTGPNGTSSFSPGGTPNNITYACYVTPTGSPSCGTAQWASGQIQITNLSTGPQAQATGTGTVCTGGTLNLLGSVTPSISATYAWYTSNNGVTWSGSPVATTQNYTPTSAGIGNVYYEVVATFSGTGCTPSTSSPVTMTTVAQPTVTTEPGQLLFCTGGAGGLSVGISTSPTPTYAWNYSLDLSSWSGVTDGTPTGVTYGSTQSTSTLSLSASGTATPGDYFYKCDISFAANTACSAISTSPSGSDGYVKLGGQPNIVGQPSDISICQGLANNIAVAATGGTILTYEWQYSPDGGTTWNDVADGTPTGITYSGASTNQLSLTASLSSTPGTYKYHCIVGSSQTTGGGNCSSTTSSYANVTISRQPALTSATSASICSGSTFNYTATSATDPSTTYTWSRASVAGILPSTGSGSTAAISETLSNSNSSAAVANYVIDMDAAGCTNEQTVAVTVNTLPAITSVTATNNPVCGGSTTQITANGVGGTGTSLVWYTGPNATGQNLGSSNPLTVGGNQTYYAHVAGTCSPAVESSINITLDNTAPSITAPGNISVYNSPNNNGNSAEVFGAPGVTDNCTGEASGDVNVLPVTSNLKAWVKAGAGVVTDGNGNVAEWRDLSGNGNNFTQTTYASRPTKTSSSTSFNGQPAIVFTSSEYLTNLTNIDGGATANYTVFVVSRLNGGTNARLIGSATNNNWALGYLNGYKDQLEAGGSAINAGTPAADASAHLYEVTSNGTTANQTILYGNGNLIASGTGSSVNGPGKLELNGYGNGAGEMSDGEVAEVIYYNTVLTQAQRQLVEGYLAYKYNLQVPLASMQAFQTYTPGSSTTVNFIASDQSGNISSTTASASGSTYPGPSVTPSTTTPCLSSDVTLSVAGMAPSGQKAVCGSSDYLTPSSSIAVGSNWTIAAWFNYPLPSSTSGGYNTLVKGTNNDNHITVQQSGSNYYLGVYQSTGSAFHSSGFDMSQLSSGWHYLAATGNGGNTYFYIDGVLVGKADYQATSNINAFGNIPGGGQQFG
ncbi:MAG TPA: LamG-like jellyroll fold domain-containing protein, partial [Chitinophagales bacterium]|nr:LamG-like jellyroll fold domain-containing protein [Chitinophagales bacterium]